MASTAHVAVGAVPVHVLRLCSVFEPPDAALKSGARFDPVGGMQTHTGQLTRALDRQGVWQTVVTHRPPGTSAYQSLGDHAVVHRFGLPVPWARQLYSGPATVAALRLAPGADLVHAHLGEDLAVLPIALAAARRSGTPLVVTVHCSLRHTLCIGDLRSRALKTAGGAIEAAICRRSEAIIALTARLAACLRADGVAPDRVHVIPSGIGTPACGTDGPDRFPDVGRPRIVYVGRLSRQKGVHALLDALTRMRARDAALLIVGDGPERRRLEATIRRRRLAGRVRITGFLPHREIPAVLAHGDVLCLPSIYEELGTVLLEAMQVGVPIVASDTGGIPDAVGPAALLVPPGDAQALAAAVDTLLADPGEAARLGALGRERVQAFDWERLACDVLSVYRLALGQRPQHEKALA